MRPSFRLAFTLGLLGSAFCMGPALLAASPAMAQNQNAQSGTGQAQQGKSYKRSDLDSNAIRLEDRLKKSAANLAVRRSIDDYRREADLLLKRNNPQGALISLGYAIAARPGDPQLWMAYARMAQITGARVSRLRWRMYSDAATAAYAAYQRAQDPAVEAQALAFLAQTYANRSLWRLSLNTYRASLKIADNIHVRNTYEALRARRGFRILDYKVDSNSTTPRICFNFSEPLARGKVDFAPYVAVSGKTNGAITTEGRQLCVEGLTHGERYSIVLRQGLPSAVEEQLLKSADYVIYVRDRAPQVRFTGKNYVLPRVGQEGIPVVSTNTQKVGIDIVKIGDRSLVPTVRADDFLSQIGSYQAKELLDAKGTKVWSGTLDVKPERNKDVTTAFPVLQAVKKLEPGVYVMLAVPGDKPASTSLSKNDGYVNNIATQWFIVSDLGLTAFSGKDGVHVLVRSLASAEPVAGTEVRLIARNNEVLATLKTDDKGHVKFDAGLSRGSGGLAPGLVAASGKEGDYAFLDLTKTAFDLTDRGVKGRPAPGALDAYVYAERGVYRSGETVNATALVRNPQGNAVGSLPLTFVVKRPDGVEYKRMQVPDQGLDGRAFSVSLLSNVPTGTWRIQVFADPKSPAIGETTFLVEDYVPERLELSLTPQQKIVQQGQTTTIDALARFLYGAPGAGLTINGQLTIQSSSKLAIPGYEEFTTGLADEKFETIRKDIDSAIKTDATGRASIGVEIPQVSTSRPVEAKFLLRAAEPGGRAVERTVTLPVRPSKNLIAAKKAFTSLAQGSQAVFDVAALTTDGKRISAKGLRWTLYRVRNSYQWYNSDGRWNFERVKTTRKIADGSVDATPDALAKISAAVGWGSHRLDIVADDGSLAPVSISFTVGWSGEASADTPDLLEVTLDKKNYAAGENLQLRLASRFTGKATVLIVGDKVHAQHIADVKQGDNVITLPVKAEWGTSAYAVALAHRPLDSQARRMPGRALGLAWFSVEAAQRKLQVTIDTPERVRPRRPMTIPVRIGGLQAGEEAYVTLAAVDVGILNLTNYKSPDPTPHFFGQKQLSTEIRDLYGLLIDGMQGTRGAIRSGGDAAGPGVEGNRPTQEPMARYSGVVKVDANGVATVTFEIPAFNGTMRLMAVAWSKSRVGAAEKDVTVRDPVVVQATLPRFLNFGDRSQFHIRIDNVDGAPGDYTVDVDVRGPVTIAADALRRTINLAAKQRTSFTIPVTGAGIGTAEITMNLSGPNLSAPQTFRLAVKPGTSDIYRRVVRSVKPNETITINNDLMADFLPGTGAVSVAVTPIGAIDVPALLQALDRYPYGCSEQIVSRAMPLLYVSQLANTKALALDDNTKERVQKSIDRVMARQDTNGAFGLWASGGSTTLWLDAFVSDFLTRARENGYNVPQTGFEQALERLRNQVANTTNITSRNAAGIAYAVYVLARNGRPVMGDLRYLADSKMESFATPLARAQIGAALALLGDKGRSTKAFESAAARLTVAQSTPFSRPDFGSLLRDSAGFLALAVEAKASDAFVTLAAVKVQQARQASRYTSTQEKNWMVLAASALATQASKISMQIDGQTHNGSYYRTWRGFALDGKGVAFTNKGQAPVQIVVTTSGAPAAREPAVSNGYIVERTFYTLDGKIADLGNVKQNDRLVAVLKITEPAKAFARLLLVDKLPAGLEIDNPKLVDSGSVAALSWLKSSVSPVHTEYRDDRFVAAYNRTGRNNATFYAAYIVRAVTPGQYVMPPATIEDMYRPERFGRTGYGTLTIGAAR